MLSNFVVYHGILCPIIMIIMGDAKAFTCLWCYDINVKLDLLGPYCRGLFSFGQLLGLLLVLVKMSETQSLSGAIFALLLVQVSSREGPLTLACKSSSQDWQDWYIFVIFYFISIEIAWTSFLGPYIECGTILLNQPNWRWCAHRLWANSTTWHGITLHTKIRKGPFCHLKKSRCFISLGEDRFYVPSAMYFL